MKKRVSGAARTRGRLAYALAVIVAAAAVLASFGDVSAQQKKQKGFTMLTCHAVDVYIYKYPSTQSDRRGRLGSKQPFRVYHYTNGAWAFGVDNNSGASGYVLRGKLCKP